jgi:hypothetical protein
MMEGMGTPDLELGDESALTWEQAVAEFEAATPGEVVRPPRTIMVIYRYLDGKWHASSPSLAGFEAYGDSLAEIQQTVRADLGGYLDPAVGLDQRVWHPWQLSTQVGGFIYATGVPQVVDISGTATSIHNFDPQVTTAVVVTSVTSTESTVLSYPAMEVSPEIFPYPPQTAFTAWPETRADERMTVVISGASTTVGLAT